VGFCAWLAELGHTGGGMSGNFGQGVPQKSSNAGAIAEQLRHFEHQAREYIAANLYWLIPTAVAVALTSLALMALVMWLSSRGKFMLLHNVALNSAEVTAPWNEYGREADSLFKFRLVVALAGMAVLLPLAILGVIIALSMISRGEANVTGVITEVGLAMTFFMLSLAVNLFLKFTTDFVVPIMYLRRQTCMAAWGEFWGLLTGHIGDFVIYLLFQIALAMAIGMLVLLVVVFTCCTAGCLMMLPYIGTVLLLPVILFKRSYSLYYLAQFGPQYEVIRSGAHP